MIKGLAIGLALAGGLVCSAQSAESKWACVKDNICFEPTSIVHSDVKPGQMMILARDKGTGDSGWVAVDCAARFAAGDTGHLFPIEDGSALAAACDTWGTEE